MLARRQGQEDRTQHGSVSDTEPVTVSTNMPMQVGTMYGVQKGNFRRDAKTVNMRPGEVRPGDVFVVGSDGLFDNLSAENIGHILTSTCGDGHIKRQLEDGTKRAFYYNRANRKTGLRGPKCRLALAGAITQICRRQQPRATLVQAAQRGKRRTISAVLRVDRPSPLNRDALKAGADARWPVV